ncbi:MAG: hypothetical protein ACKO5P_00070 [Nodosilinea sp.]
MLRTRAQSYQLRDLKTGLWVNLLAGHRSPSQSDGHRNPQPIADLPP